LTGILPCRIYEPGNEGFLLVLAVLEEGILKMDVPVQRKVRPILAFPSQFVSLGLGYVYVGEPRLAAIIVGGYFGLAVPGDTIKVAMECCTGTDKSSTNPTCTLPIQILDTPGISDQIF